jgi:hypothetical protein
VVKLVGKLAVAGAGGAALAGSFLLGYALGTVYALNSVANLRHLAECRAQEGRESEACEWVFNSSVRQLAGEPVPSSQHGDRYAKPFEGVPVLGRLTYDLAHPPRGPVRVYP